MTLQLISVVIPARNEEANISRLEIELQTALQGLPYAFEFVVVDNHSTDRTGDLTKEICCRDSQWRYLRFSRDFTVEMSITAGYHYATGDAIVVLYSDLQDPPDVIPRLIAKWQEGFDVVYGVRTVRPGDPKWRNFAVGLAYRLISSFSEMPIPQNAGDFRLITRQVRDALEQCREYNRYMRGLIAWLGFRQASVLYERRPRTAGVSKAPFWDLLFFVFNAVTSFSLKPLRVFLMLGIILISLSVLSVPVYTYLYFVGHAPPGITTLVILSFLGVGLNSLGIGILGEYIGRTYAEVKQRPLYVVEETMNLGETQSSR
jgi:polyisoprenyl-phosphate glycosyltransferase